MKHVGRMKNNGARVAIAYRTLPGDPHSALVIGTQGLGDSYHDTLMSLIESDAGQQANELAEVLAVRRFPDGSVMLGYLHANGHLKKVSTANVLVTPDSQTQIPLNELNEIIAKQKGVDLEDLAVSDGSPKKPKTTKKVQVEESVSTDTKTTTFEMTPAEMRSRADALYKEAARLRKDADAMDPPKSKKKAVVEVE
jgi:hypothetical protein